MKRRPVSTFDVNSLDDIILPIRPEHARRLYSGEKKFELRKVAPRRVPRRIFLYETENGTGITGHIVVERMISLPPQELWRITGEVAAPRERFFAYFSGFSVGNAFEVAAAVRYERPVSQRESGEIDGRFKPPQGFLYLKNLPKLHSHLSSFAATAALRTSYKHLTLRPIDSDQEALFSTCIQQHIAGSYKETGRAYAATLLKLHRQGFDQEGILTVKKRVFAIRLRGELAGFVVLTDKLGGSVKTGPTVLLETFQNRGVGKALRGLLHKTMLRQGARKVYCTVPAVKAPAVQYLLSSGYRIEAHLHRQYHGGHDELVLGRLLQSHRCPQGENAGPQTPFPKTQRIRKLSAEAVDFLNTEFTAHYCEVPDGWAERQLAESVAFGRGAGSKFKPRIAFAAAGTGIEAMGLCALKRGGSAKLLVLARSEHAPSLLDFLRSIEKSLASLRKAPVRRLYSFCPVHMTTLLRCFYDAGFRPEGIIERPYNNRVDLIVFGKPLLRKDARSQIS